MKKIKTQSEVLNYWKTQSHAYPAYDGKAGRTTECEILSVNDEGVTIKGHLWGDEEKNRELKVLFTFPTEGVEKGCSSLTLRARVKYDREKTLMMLLGISEDGDYYSLYSKDFLDSIYED
jgi:hypothetical protein